MIRLLRNDGNGYAMASATADAIGPDALWYDVASPTSDELAAVEAALGLTLPTPEKMQEIEYSSRFHVTEGGTVMTAVVMNKSETERPEPVSVTFILAGDRLVTLRYADPRPFRVIEARITSQRLPRWTAQAVMLVILETIVDRIADILERITADLDHFALDVFHTVEAEEKGKTHDYREVLIHIGRSGDLASKARESLLSIQRLVTYFTVVTETKTPKDLRVRLKTLARDVKSLIDHASFVSGKVMFLLDATLGMISIEQSDIIKIFSVVAVMFVPATLIASIYGMNFEWMPELRSTWGYPLSILGMLLSALLPYLYFKRRGWL